LIVARDIAHAKIKEIDAGKPMPEYLKPSSLLYPWSQNPEGMPSGSLDQLPLYSYGRSENIGSMIMLAKGNRTAQVVNACKTYGGFYLDQ
jgi:fumarate hydratase class I